MKHLTLLLTVSLIGASPLSVSASKKSQRLTQCTQVAKAIVGPDVPVKLSRFKGRRDRIVELKIGNGSGFEKYDCHIEADMAVITSRSGQPLKVMAAESQPADQEVEG